MKRKILSIFLCSLMLTGGVCGCSKDESNVDTSKSSSTVEETGYKTMEPPEDGWTIEELLSVTYICDNQLSYPLTMDLLENNVEIMDGTLEVQNEKNVIAKLSSDNEFMGAIFFNRNNLDDISGDTPINTISFDTHSDFFEKNGSPIILNGVSFGDTKEELIDALGSKAKINEETYTITYIFDEIQDLKFIASYDDQGCFGRITFYNLDKGE